MLDVWEMESIIHSFKIDKDTDKTSHYVRRSLRRRRLLFGGKSNHSINQSANQSITQSIDQLKTLVISLRTNPSPFSYTKCDAPVIRKPLPELSPFALSVQGRKPWHRVVRAADAFVVHERGVAALRVLVATSASVSIRWIPLLDTFGIVSLYDTASQCKRLHILPHPP